MSDIAKLQIGEDSYEFPLVKGTENEVAIDIKSLRGATNGVITIDPGYKNTGSCERWRKRNFKIQRLFY